MGWSERIALKHVYYQVWNTSPVQGGCMRQVLGAGALGWPRGMGKGGRWEGGSGWGTYVHPWLIHVNVWQKPLQYCKIISLQLTNIKKKQTNKSKPKFQNHHLGLLLVLFLYLFLMSYFYCGKIYIIFTIFTIFKSTVPWHEVHSYCAAITTVRLENFIHLPHLKLCPR